MGGGGGGDRLIMNPLDPPLRGIYLLVAISYMYPELKNTCRRPTLCGPGLPDLTNFKTKFSRMCLSILYFRVSFTHQFRFMQYTSLCL